MRAALLIPVLLSVLVSISPISSAQSAPSYPSVFQDFKEIELRRDWGGLVRRIDTLIKSDPSSPVLWSMRATYLLRLLRYEDAIRSSRKAIQLSPNYGLAWSDLGIALWRTGHQQDAIDALKEAVRLEPRHTWAWLNLWGVLTETSRYTEIPVVIDHIRAIEPRSAATFLKLLGDPILLTKRVAAIPMIADTHGIHCRGESKAASQRARDDAMTLLAAGEAVKAANALEKTISQLTKTECRYSPEDLLLRDLLLIAYMQSLRVSDALGQHIRSHDVSDALEAVTSIGAQLAERFGKTSPEYLRTELAKAYFRLIAGDISAALGPALDAYATASITLGTSDRTTQWLEFWLGAAYARLGRYEDGRNLLIGLHERSKRNFGELDPLTWLASYEIAGIDKKTGKSSPKVLLDAVATDKCKQILGDDHTICLNALGSVALSLGREGKISAAEDIFQEIRAKLSEAYGDDTPDLLALEYARVQMLYGAKYFVQASEVLDSLVPSAEQRFGKLAPISLQIRLLRAYVDVGNNRFGEASAIGRKLLSDVEDARADVGLTPDDRQKFLSWYAGLHLGQALSVSPLNPDEAFRLSESAKARTLLDSVALTQANRSGVLDSQDQAQVDEYEHRIQDIARQLSDSSDSPVSRLAMDQRYQRALLDYTKFRKELKQKNPRYGALTEFPLISAREGVERVLDDDTTFLSFLYSETTVLGFALSKNEGLQIQVVDIKNVASNVEAMRDALYNGTTEATVTRLSKEFGDALIKPFGAVLANKRRLIISPDGPLAFLPFEVLTVNGKRLVDSLDVSYSPSLSVLALTRQRDIAYRGPDQRRQLLAMGGAIYDPTFSSGIVRSKRNISADSQLAIAELRQSTQSRDASGKAFRLMDIKWANLPGTKREVEAVAQLFGPSESRVFLGAEASESQLQGLNKSKELSRYRYLLFSAHGYLSPVEPALSAVVLSQLDKTPDADGYITVSEWPSYDLRSDLIVLSACDTGVGKFVQGEGILGLPYALYVAGNKNLLLTLWPIDDDATKEFMHEFFGYIKIGNSASDALAKTKRTFVRSEHYSDPRYWAPFVLYGY